MMLARKKATFTFLTCRIEILKVKTHTPAPKRSQKMPKDFKRSQTIQKIPKDPKRFKGSKTGSNI